MNRYLVRAAALAAALLCVPAQPAHAQVAVYDAANFAKNALTELHTLQTGTRVINNPEAGIMRIVLNGNAHNVGNVSADVVVFSLTSFTPSSRVGDRLGSVSP